MCLQLLSQVKKSVYFILLYLFGYMYLVVNACERNKYLRHLLAISFIIK